MKSLTSCNESSELERNLSVNDVKSNLQEFDHAALIFDIFQSSVDGMIVFNKEEIIIEANPAFCRSIGKTLPDVIGLALKELVPKDKHFKLEKQWEILHVKDEVKGILPVIHDGEISYFDFRTSRLSTNDGLFVSILRDVTDRRDLEQKVKRNEDLYKDLFLEALDGVVFWDNNGKIIDANESARKIFECSLEELKNKKINDFAYYNHEKFDSIMYELKKKEALREELLFLMPNGQKKYLEFTVKMHAVEGYHMTIFRNVSERHRMEMQLRESEKKFRSIFEGALEGLTLWDDELKIVDMNEAGARMLSVTPDDIRGKVIKHLLTGCGLSDKELKDQLERVIVDGKSEATFSILMPSGKRKYFEASTKHHVFSDLSLTTFRDITDRLELEEQLHKSDTLNVIGELAAGIAHEIRNPMTALKGFIQLLEDSVKEDHTMYFSVIKTELNRIESIINEFLILAKPQVVKFVNVDICKIMQETVDLLSAQAVLHDIQFHTLYKKGIQPVYCEPNQMKKVFINIIKNAIEVMSSGGFITIGIEETADRRLKVSIKDEGYGIPPEKIKKLGEPFYTTKERGTGLGLMVTYKIIKEHNGQIEVESRVGKGTVFHIYLPLDRG